MKDFVAGVYFEGARCFGGFLVDILHHLVVQRDIGHSSDDVFYGACVWWVLCFWAGVWEGSIDVLRGHTGEYTEGKAGERGMCGGDKFELLVSAQASRPCAASKLAPSARSPSLLESSPNPTAAATRRLRLRL